MTERYRDYGYHALAITDHHGDPILGTTLFSQAVPADPRVPGITFIHGLEDSSGLHLLPVGTRKNPLDIFTHLMGLPTKLRYYDSADAQCAFLVAAHPLADSSKWSDGDLSEWRLDAIELREEPAYLDLWRGLLNKRQMFAICADDAHTPAEINRGWVMVQAPSAAPSASEIVASLKRGAFFAVRAAAGQVPAGKAMPGFSRFEIHNERLTVTAVNATRGRVFTKTRIADCPVTAGSMLFTADLDDCNFFIELSDAEGNVAYSQPFTVHEIDDGP